MLREHLGKLDAALCEPARLCIHARVRLQEVAQAVNRLPPAFRSDPLVLDNLENLRRDAQRWSS